MVGLWYTPPGIYQLFMTLNCSISLILFYVNLSPGGTTNR